MCWCSAATGRALQSPPGLFRLASREGIVLAFETLELEILLACRCSISISTPSPLLTYHHAVQTYLARRLGKASRPPPRKHHQLTPPRAGPSALLRCKPFDCRAQYAKPVQPPSMRPPIDNPTQATPPPTPTSSSRPSSAASTPSPSSQVCAAQKARKEDCRDTTKA